MKVSLVKAGKLSRGAEAMPAGTVLDGKRYPDCWRLCFPVKGCLARPADAEAAARILTEIEACDTHTRARLVAHMSAAGTFPMSGEQYPADAPQRPEYLQNVAADVEAASDDVDVSTAEHDKPSRKRSKKAAESETPEA